MAYGILLGVPLLIGALLWLRHKAKQRKRAAVLATPLTDQQRAIVARLVPITRRLPQDLRAKLEGMSAGRYQPGMVRNAQDRADLPLGVPDTAPDP